MPGMQYTLFTAGETRVGGLTDLPEQAKQMGNAGELDGLCRRRRRGRQSLSGQAPRRGVCMSRRTDIPNVGRFAVDRRPAGGGIWVVQVADKPGPDQSTALGTPGHVGWHELLAADWEKAFAFYAELFGCTRPRPSTWARTVSISCSPRAGSRFGGMFTKPPMVPVPFWLYYFKIGGIDAGSGAREGRRRSHPQRPDGSAGRQLDCPMRGPTRCLMFALVGNQGRA